MVLVQLGPELSTRLVQFVLALVFMFGAVPAAYLLGKLFDRFV
ncbi:hypothetical protein [Haloferax sp. DFSO52]